MRQAEWEEKEAGRRGGESNNLVFTLSENLSRERGGGWVEEEGV